MVAVGPGQRKDGRPRVRRQSLLFTRGIDRTRRVRLSGPARAGGLAITRHGRIIEQAEDEIAAINMAIGASFAGVRALTATSGGCPTFPQVRPDRVMILTPASSSKPISAPIFAANRWILGNLTSRNSVTFAGS